MITQDELKKLFNYNTETGEFTNITYRGPRAQIGTLAGHMDKDGYIIISIDGRRYGAHQLAFVYMTGLCPKEIDHEDRQPWNNKWSNLREATHSENMQNRSVQSNNTSGCPGVYWDPNGNSWRVQIYVKDKKTNLGSYVDLNEAIRVRREAAKEHHKQFASI